MLSPSAVCRYENGALVCEKIPLAQLARRYGTPCYHYSAGAAAEHYRALARALAAAFGRSGKVRICYALKANGALALVRLFAGLGAGGDIVSGGEMELALAAGMKAKSLVFSGTGKSAKELAAALKEGVGQINAESEAELAMLAAWARRTGKKPPVALRVNPDIDSGGHDKITTGRLGDKFGISWREIPRLYAQMSGAVSPRGLAVHIGSQIDPAEPALARGFARLAGLARELMAAGYRVPALDLGGGLAQPDDRPPDFTGYARLAAKHFAGFDGRLIVEPGRALIARAGILLTRVILQKPARRRPFLIVDAAMNDFLRPALYGAAHPVLPLLAGRGAARAYDIAGPVCESGDILAKNVRLAGVQAGDYLAFLNTGAYGAAQASGYNMRPLTAEVLLHGEKHALIRPRLTAKAMIRRQRIPLWLAKGR